ncbi:hypothetical protein EYZ11_012426 [Aspergillus tanneri]|uniref:Uncharacterized protein n=1 Tax=Aspergillus tanneri TaxID=1220188 RepID=A0A4S3J2D7_9EURO|nr:hypothetical protein EYZ11_012426 [Aspergillus tanneri]
MLLCSYELFSIGFPHRFSNFEKIDFEIPNPGEFDTKALQEFPLTNPVFNNGMEPGIYRTVFAKRIATDDWEPIGIMRHKVGGNTGEFLRVEKGVSRTKAVTKPE